MFALSEISKELKQSRRIKLFWVNVRRTASANGVDPDKAVKFVRKTGLPPFSADTTVDIKAWLAGKEPIAQELGVDWEGVTQFMEALMPLILEMMAACGA